jgi:hypothetical protein
MTFIVVTSSRFKHADVQLPYSGESNAYPGDPTFELSLLAEYKLLFYINYYITTSTVNNCSKYT